MQAPNKVYILPSQYNLQYDNGGEEYIRKEAFLEWAKEIEEKYVENGYGERGFYELLDKIESL